jgi:hypothetical protein
MLKAPMMILFFCSIINAEYFNSEITGKIVNESLYNKIDTLYVNATYKDTIHGILLDVNNNIISDSVLNSSIKWEYIGGDSLQWLLVNEFGNKLIFSSNFAYTEYFIKMSCNNVPMDTIVIRIISLPSYRICVDTSTNINIEKSIREIIMYSDSISLYLYLLDSYGNNVGSITGCKWTLLDSTQISVEKTMDVPHMYTIKALKNIIDTDLYFNLDSLYSDTIHVSKHSSSLSFQKPKTNINRRFDVTSYNLLGKKIVNPELNKIGCLLIRLKNDGGRPISNVLVR